MTVANLISYLYARGHVVDLYALRTGAHVSSEDVTWLAEHCRKVRLYRHGRVHQVIGAASAVLRHHPLQVGIFRNRRQARDVQREVRRGSYDVVYTYYLRSAEATRSIGHRALAARCPVNVLALQLSQSLNTARILRTATRRVVRWIYRYEHAAISDYESRIWKHFDGCVLIGQRDLDAINEECDRRALPRIDNVVFGQHGTDVDRFRPKDPGIRVQNRVLFNGVMRTPTNIQAVQWFVRRVWPLVLCMYPDAEFWIVGREPSAEVRALDSAASVVVTGTVERPEDLIATAHVCVNPMQAGGGMQNKLLEYLASGKPTVATTVANEGIGAPSRVLAVADDPADFADNICKILGDDSLAAELGANARRYVEQAWTWETHFEQLEQNLLRFVAEREGERLDVERRR
jgi:glycosyltransferase involved in cell wall biosynthesis